jgi:hypothetical protein
MATKKTKVEPKVATPKGTRRPSPTKKDYFTKEQVETAIRKACGILSGAGEILGMPRRSVSRYLERYPELREVQDEVRQQMVDKAEQVLYQHLAEGNDKVAIFIAKTLGKDRGWSERSEVTGANGGPVSVAVAKVVVLPPEEPIG